MAGVMKHTMVVRNPDTLEATALLAGEPVPDWVTDDLVHPDNFESASAAKESTGYGSQKAGDLQDEADKRGLTVDGTGKDGAVVKADLVAALEADDAANA